MTDSRWPEVGQAIREGLNLARRARHPSLPDWQRIGALYNVVVAAGDQQVPAAEELRSMVLGLLGHTLKAASADVSRKF